jgi:putative RNA 2'-phosphotransferase
MKDGELARLLSLILRHEPERIGLTLDGQGWANVPDLLRLAKRAGKPFDLDTLSRVVETNDKRRFTLSPDGQRIRAAQGHSLPVDLGLPAVQPPGRLWHGTARDNLPSIFRDGLKPGRRQMVHLSGDRETAQRVGERHGKAVILAVEAGLMFSAGIPFHQADNGVWLVPRVSSEYLAF